MPKMKTHKGAAKRFRKTKNGHFKYSVSGQRHLLTGKSSNLKRKNRRPAVVSLTEEKLLRRLIPGK